MSLVRLERWEGQRLPDLEAEVVEREGSLQNAADEWHGALDDLRSIGEAWESARAALETEAVARRNAEAVRRVVSQIVLTF